MFRGRLLGRRGFRFREPACAALVCSTGVVAQQQSVGKTAACDTKRSDGSDLTNAASCTSLGRPHILVVGGGVVGASTAYSLARRGHRVTLLDAADPFRSSWGETRIGGLAQSCQLFVNFMRRARQLWLQLEDDSDMLLLKKVGTLGIGEPPLLDEIAGVFGATGLSYERFGAEELARRYPQVRLLDGQEVLWQPDGWVILAERCLQALTEQARRFGADVKILHSLESCDTAAKIVTTDEGERISYDKLVLCCGPWTNQALQRSGLRQLPLVVSMEQQTFFDPRPGQEELYDWNHLPIVLNATSEPGSDFYTIPHVVDGVRGVKVSVHREGQLMHNDEHQIPAGTSFAELPNHDHSVVGEFSAELDGWMAKAAQRFVRQHYPGLEQTISHHYRCRYTSVAVNDGGFCVGPHPDRPEDVIVAAAFHGEGFKFGIATGELAADLALGLPPRVPAAAAKFAPARLLASSSTASR
eukprot:TRINITY_DN72270_c0_g1_i1.p1 TRINITY_DN72270_c0_g1~~TRINITY_DN72270_c0_g1_i1.p1  ORF type:complete len:471 (+),score=108.39 TRINITY_DN72270_c0_g1_i1:80-1492(+)